MHTIIASVMRVQYNDPRGQYVPYETFERRVTRTEDPALSVLADGRIALNAAATRLFQGAGATAVKLLWDKAKCGIALQATEKGDKNSYSIYFSRGRSAFISAKTFLPYIGWSSDRSQTVPARWNAQLRMLEAELPARFVSARKTFADWLPEDASELVKPVRRQVKRGTKTGL
jgi:hypothetical protein